MNRHNLVVDTQLLHRATKAIGAKTYSAAVNRALSEMLEGVERRALLADLRGSGIWQGDLAAMRADAPPRVGASRRRPRTGRSRR